MLGLVMFSIMTYCDYRDGFSDYGAMPILRLAMLCTGIGELAFEVWLLHGDLK